MMFQNLPTDRIYKFLTFLGLAIIIAGFTFTERKRERVFNALEVYRQKSDSVINGYKTNSLMIQARIEADKIIDRTDSFKLSEMKADTFLKYSQIKIDAITSANASHRIEDARFKADMEIKESDMKGFEKTLDRVSEDLDN